MFQFIDAIFENGVLRPLVPPDLTEHELVHLQIARTAAPPAQMVDESPEVIAQQRRAHEELLAAMAKLPIECPDDNFSGRDHDLVLYGWKK